MQDVISPAMTGGPSAASDAVKSPLGMNGQKPPQSDHGVYDIPVGATTTDLPTETLYKVCSLTAVKLKKKNMHSILCFLFASYLSSTNISVYSIFLFERDD